MEPANYHIIVDHRIGVRVASPNGDRVVLCGKDGTPVDRELGQQHVYSVTYFDAHNNNLGRFYPERSHTYTWSTPVWVQPIRVTHGVITPPVTTHLQSLVAFQPIDGHPPDGTVELHRHPDCHVTTDPGGSESIPELSQLTLGSTSHDWEHSTGARTRTRTNATSIRHGSIR